MIFEKMASVFPLVHTWRSIGNAPMTVRTAAAMCVMALPGSRKYLATTGTGETDGIDDIIAVL
jgi:hypothetical protein